MSLLPSSRGVELGLVVIPLVDMLKLISAIAEKSAPAGNRYGVLTRWPRVVLFIALIGVVCVLILHKSASVAQNRGYSLRFYGHGVDDIDRVMIPIDPSVPADVGATDFTIEWWMKATLEQNGSPSCTPGGDKWIYGNLIFDRDIWGPGDYGDYGISLAAGRIAFGANHGDSGETLCGSILVADGDWHHVAVTRRRSDGLMRMFVDGQLDGEVDGPGGDVSYRDGRSTWTEDDPFLVIGAEKHDAGPAYPSYSGWIDEVRLSDVVRYTTGFEPPSAPFTSDGNTVALYHLDEGPASACTGTVLDSSGASGGPSHGTCNYGGADPAGPVYTTDVAFVNTLYLPLVLRSFGPSAVEAYPFWGLAVGLVPSAVLVSVVIVSVRRRAQIRRSQNASMGIVKENAHFSARGPA